MQKVTRIINEWDPADLISMGAYEDEYSSEVRKIRAFFEKHKVTVEEAADKIKEIFENSFFEDIFSCSDEKYKSIARQLLEVDWEKEALINYSEEYMTMKKERALINAMYKVEATVVEIPEYKDDLEKCQDREVLIKKYNTLHLDDSEYEKQVGQNELAGVKGDHSPLSYVEAAMLYNELHKDSYIYNDKIVREYENDDIGVSINGAVFYTTKAGNPTVEYTIVDGKPERGGFSTVICVFSEDTYEMETVLRPVSFASK